jgi:hypothetical protein
VNSPSSVVPASKPVYLPTFAAIPFGSVPGRIIVLTVLSVDFFAIRRKEHRLTRRNLRMRQIREWVAELVLWDV